MSFRKSGFVANSGITVDTLLVSDQLRVGDKIRLNEDGDIVEANIRFINLTNNGNEVIFADNNGLLNEISKPVATGRYLTYNPSSQVYSFVDIATEEGFLKDDQIATITAVFTFSTTPKFSALSNGFLKITSGDGTIESASIATADLPNTISPQLLNTNFLNIVSLLSSDDKYFVDYSGSGDKLDFHHVETTGGGDVTTDILSLSKTTFNFNTSSYQSAGFLQTSATGEVTTGAIGTGDLPSIPNSSLANSAITVGSTSISLGATSTSVAGLTALTSTKVSTDEVIINVNDGSDSFIIKQGVAGAGGITSLEMKAGSNRIIICNPNSSIALGSHYESVGFLQTTATGEVTTGAIGTGDLPSSIPNSSLANSAITVGSTSISLGASATTIAGLTSVTSTKLITPECIINVDDGDENFTLKQAPAGAGGVESLELTCSQGSVNSLMMFNPNGAILLNSTYGVANGFLRTNGSGLLASSALVVGDLPTDIPTANISSSDTLFTLGGNNVTRGEDVGSLTGLSNIGFDGELRFNDSGSNFKMEYSTALSADFLKTKHSSDELETYTKTSGGNFSKTNYIDVINRGYNSFYTTSNKLRIGILPSMFAISNNDSGNDDPPFIIRAPTINSNKFGMGHPSSSVEMYFFYQIPYGYKGSQARINTFELSDGSETNQTLKLFRYKITANNTNSITTTTTNATYTFDDADNVKTDTLDDPYYIVFQIDYTNDLCIKGGFLDLEALTN